VETVAAHLPLSHDNPVQQSELAMHPYPGWPQMVAQLNAPEPLSMQ